MTKIQLTTGDVLTVQESPDEIKSQAMLKPYVEVREMILKSKRLTMSNKVTHLNPMYIVWFE